MPTVVITGSAGFIGSHLAETLLDRGYRVIGIDNLLTGDTANIAHLAGRDFQFIKHDVTNYIYVDGPVDFVLHWASPASPIDYLELPIQTLKVGALGTHKALGLAKAKGARFVIASTSEVYGDPLEHPQRESYWGNVNPVGPRGVYDEAKRFAEAMTMAYHRYHGVDTKIVRIFNTYGPRMRVNDGRAVPAFMSQALRNEDVTDLRRRQPDAQLLLRHRSGRRHHPADALGHQRSGEHRQPARDDDQGDRRDDHPHDRLEEPAGLQAAPHRRPQGAQAGHHPRPHDPRLGTEGRARTGSRLDDHLLPPEARGVGRDGRRPGLLRLEPASRGCA